MKELTIEQKAKAYDEAIERAKMWYYAPNSDKIPTYANRIVSDIFPELKESEDERIRKDMIETIKKESKDFPSSVIAEKSHTWIAWLKKQGEQKPTEEWYDFIRWFVKQRTDDYTLIPSDDDIHKWGDNILNHARKVLDQKPAECKEDVNCRTTGYWVVSPVEERQDNSEIEPLEPWSDDQIINYIITLLRNNNMNNKESKGINESIEIWLKSLKDRVQPQPQQEWSEEDERALNDAIVALSMYANGDILPILPSILLEDVEKLKSLRPQKQCCNDVPSREYILNVWELGNYWKELTNGVCSTEYGTELEYIQKYWKEGGYYDKISACTQKQWKPSKEQMEALNFAANCIVPAEFCIKRKILKELLEHLKKLREE